MDKARVLIMIPAYNEAAVIGSVVRDIKHAHPAYDIVVINDGSRDKTAFEAERAGAYVATLPYNLGIGGAVQTGFKIAADGDYDIAVQMDGDGQHDPACLNDLLKPVLNGECDLAVGSRFLNMGAGFKSSFTRRIGIRFFAILLSFLTRQHLTDPTSGFRATGKILIKRFAEYYPIDFPEPEAIQMARRLGARIKEIPVVMRERTGGISSIRHLKTVYYMIKVTLAILIDTLRKKN